MPILYNTPTVGIRTLYRSFPSPVRRARRTISVEISSDRPGTLGALWRSSRPRRARRAAARSRSSSRARPGWRRGPRGRTGARDAVPPLIGKHPDRALHYSLDHPTLNAILRAAAIVQVPPRLQADSVRLIDHRLRIRKVRVPNGRSVRQVEGAILRKAAVPAAIEPKVPVAEIDERCRPTADGSRSRSQFRERVFHESLGRPAAEGIVGAPTERRRQAEAVVDARYGGHEHMQHCGSGTVPAASAC